MLSTISALPHEQNRLVWGTRIRWAASLGFKTLPPRHHTPDIL